MPTSPVVSTTPLTVARPGDGGSNLFEGLTLSFHPGDRVGLVGPNGIGKSTLLQVLAGKIDPLHGSVSRKDGSRLEYVPQQVSLALLERTVSEACTEKCRQVGADPDSERWQVEASLDRLGIDDSFYTRTMRELSGGEIQRVALGLALGFPSSCLFLDEPTNNLDIDAVSDLVTALSQYEGPFCVVSHHRDFLDGVTNRTVFLDGGHRFDFPGPFSPARLEYLRRQEALEHTTEVARTTAARKVATARRLEEFLRKNPHTQRAVGQAKRRAEEAAAAVPIKLPERPRVVEFGVTEIQAPVLMRCKEGPIAREGSKPLFTLETPFELERGDRIALLGPNGSGKSTFLKACVDGILGSSDLTDRVVTPPGLNVAYYDQGLVSMNAETSIREWISQGISIPLRELHNELFAAGFEFDRLSDPVCDLSRGERARLKILRIKFVRPHLLVLDEPTNDLDIDGIEDLVCDLSRPTVTCMFVSHEPRFVQEVATKCLAIHDGRLRRVSDPRTYFDWLAARGVDRTYRGLSGE